MTAFGYISLRAGACISRDCCFHFHQLQHQFILFERKDFDLGVVPRLNISFDL